MPREAAAFEKPAKQPEWLLRSKKEGGTPARTTKEIRTVGQQESFENVREQLMQRILIEGKGGCVFPARKELRKYSTEHAHDSAGRLSAAPEKRSDPWDKRDKGFLDHMKNLFKATPQGDPAAARRGVSDMLVLFQEARLPVLGKETVTRQEERFFGFWNKTIVEEKPVLTGYRQRTSGEVVPGGSQEPNWKMYYRTTNSMYTPGTKDPGSSTQGTVELMFDLPESLAREVETMARHDPSFIRDLIGRQAQNTLGFTRQEWDESGPYSFESWQEQESHPLYVQSGYELNKDERKIQRFPAFSEANVVSEFKPYEWEVPLSASNPFLNEEKQRGGSRERSEAEIDRIIMDHLSYRDALPDREPNLQSASARKYARALAELMQKQPFDQTKQRIREAFWKSTEALGLATTPVAESESWAEWDLAKQEYFANHPDEADRRYRIAHPLEDVQIQQEIADRHLGWELYSQSYRFEKGKPVFDRRPCLGNLRSDHPSYDEIMTLLQKAPNVEIAKYQEATLSSVDLARLGRLIRENLGVTLIE